MALSPLSSCPLLSLPCSPLSAPQLSAGPPLGPFPRLTKLTGRALRRRQQLVSTGRGGGGAKPSGHGGARRPARMPARAEGSHVARLPTTCSRNAPSANLASHLRSGAMLAGAPRLRRQAMCFWERRAPAAPIRCCAQTSCGRRRLWEKMNSLISFLPDFTSSTKTPQNTRLRARLPDVFPKMQ